MIQFRLLKDGGFVVGDSDTLLTAYAYPTSPHATMARTMPERVANEMIKSAKRCTIPAGIRDNYDARNWAQLAKA